MKEESWQVHKLEVRELARRQAGKEKVGWKTRRDSVSRTTGKD